MRKLMQDSGRLIAILVLVLAVLGRMLAAFHNNAQNIYAHPELPRHFIPNAQVVAGTYTYTWDGSVISPLLDSGVPGDITVVLKQPVRYYTLEDGEFQLHHTLSPGTRVYYREDITMYMTLATRPTKYKGWRFAHNLCPLSGECDPNAFEDSDAFKKAVLREVYAQNHFGAYYVRLEDVISYVETVYFQEPDHWRRQMTNPYIGIFPSAEETELDDEDVINAMVYYRDYSYYKDGWYCSPDFYHPYFDAANIVLLSAAGVLLTLHVVLRVRRARQQRQVEGGRK